MRKLYNQASTLLLFSLCALLLPSALVVAQNAPVELVRLKLVGQGYNDEIVVYTDSSATLAFDGQLDAEKVPNYLPGPTFASMSSDPLKLSINAIPLGSTTTRIPLSLVVGVNGTYSINTTELTGFSIGDDVIFEDVLLQVSQSIFVTPNYSFSFTTADPDTGRFYLNFSPDSTVVGNHEKFKEDGYKLISANANEIRLQLNESKSQMKDLKLFDLSGKQLGLSYTFANGIYSIYPANDLVAGLYLLNLLTDKDEMSIKFFITGN